MKNKKLTQKKLTNSLTKTIKMKPAYKVDLKSNVLKNVLKTINLQSKNKTTNKKLIRLILSSKKMQNYNLIDSFFETTNWQSELNLPWKKINTIKSKLNKKVLFLLKKKNTKLFKNISTYWQSHKSYKMFINNIRRKKYFVYANKKHTWKRIKLFLQLWMLKLFNKNVNLKIVNHSKYQRKKTWQWKIRKAKVRHFKKKNIYLVKLTTAAVDLARYNKYNELLYICSTEFEKQKKKQHNIIKSFYEVLKRFKPDRIRTFKIQIRGRINSSKRRLKVVKQPVGKKLPMQQYYKDISFHETQSRPRIGTFGLSIWLEHFVDDDEWKYYKLKYKYKQPKKKKKESEDDLAFYDNWLSRFDLDNKKVWNKIYQNKSHKIDLNKELSKQPNIDTKLTEKTKKNYNKINSQRKKTLTNYIENSMPINNQSVKSWKTYNSNKNLNINKKKYNKNVNSLRKNNVFKKKK